MLKSCCDDGTTRRLCLLEICVDVRVVSYLYMFTGSLRCNCNSFLWHLAPARNYVRLLRVFFHLYVFPVSLWCNYHCSLEQVSLTP